MKFVDEVEIIVEAGNGSGCLSFRRENTLRKEGQMEETVEMVAAFSLWVIVLNTLVDFRFQPRYRAQSGKAWPRK